jgi:hypothetical protein
MFAIEDPVAGSDQAKVVTPVPPAEEAEALPSDCEQCASTPLAETTRGAGSVRVNDCVMKQPLASVIVQVYVPAVSEEAVCPVPPEGAHA